MKLDFRTFLRRAIVLRCGLLLLGLLATLIVSGCGGISGKYADGQGNTIEFEGDHAYVTFYPAPTMEAQYEVAHDKVIIRSTGDAMVLTLNGDTLEGGPFGMKFTRAQIQ